MMPQPMMIPGIESTRISTMMRGADDAHDRGRHYRIMVRADADQAGHAAEDRHDP